jgi:hypothetical protein
MDDEKTITTLDDLVRYLEENLKHAKDDFYDVQWLCTRMWKAFTPHALSFEGTPWVLEMIAAFLTKPEEDESAVDETEDVET